MSDDPVEFNDREWHLIQQAVKPMRFQSEEWSDLHYKLCLKGMQE